MALLSDVIIQDTRANQPAAAAGNAGYLYIVSDEGNIIEYSNGSSWVQVAADATTLLDLISSTQGSVLYRGASAWAALTPGTDGDVLTTHGAAANPTWEAAGGAGLNKFELAGTGNTATGIWDQSVDGTTAAAKFEGLSAYSEIFLFATNVTRSASSTTRAQVGHGGTPTYLTANGDYRVISSPAGSEADSDGSLALHSTSTTAARTSWVHIRFWDSTIPKFGHIQNNTVSYRIPTTNALTAIQVVSSTGANLDGGIIYCWGLPA